MNDIGNADLNRLVHEMRALATRSGLSVGADQAAGNDIAPSGDRVSFSDTLSGALQQVNGLQQRSADLAAAFERGDPQVDIARVMVASQKAGLAFEAVTEVRNRLIRAYQDVMNMSV